MTREELVKLREKSWARLSETLMLAEGTQGVERLGPQGIQELAQLYRGLASDLMRVRRDKLGADLERHLDNLASRAHNALYAGSSVGNRFSIGSLFTDFPGALRRNMRFFLLACVLFFGSTGLAGWASYADETYALAVLSPAHLARMEEMHSKGHKEGREGNTNAAMTGFYVNNNVGIAFRCFATGVLFGLGPLFFLLYNGIVSGVVVGHLARTGYGENIFSFVSSHAPWELTAIVIAGAAGIQMGWAMVSTRGRTRLGNLQAHGLELLRQVAGTAAFLLLAAVIEGWYSPSSLPVEVKYVTGLVGWVLVAVIIFAAGRDRPVPADVLALERSRGPR
ncbi:stage II sporulation protein M [Myxococcota bacterium]|nr:stage II sporulation protein M [Myxococcota bacterium]